MKHYVASPLRFAIFCALLLLIGVSCSSVAFAQLGFPSQMFDPDCYFPQVGTPGEIDTIYGSVPYQFLGNALTGIGPAPREKYNRIAFQGLAPITDSSFPSSSFGGGRPISPPFDAFQGSSSFRLNALHSIAKSNIPLTYCKFVHLRSTEYLDAVYHEGIRTDLKIYWSDANGNYDTNRVTLLLGGSGRNQFFGSDGEPIIGRFSHDSTDDILMFYDTVGFTKVYLSWFDGQHLFGRDTARADSAIFFENYTVITGVEPNVRIGRTGDFQGSGRTSFIASDPNLNLYYFANTRPFFPQEFVDAMLYDTLLTHRENPQFGIKARMGAQIYANSIAMSVFPKSTGDLSQDFLILQFDSLDKANNYPEHIYCFKGGPQFGAKRLYLDSAEYILHTPQEFNIAGFGLDEFGMHNCGDMTGSGYNVLELYGEYGNALNSFFFFYVTGKALDSRVDMAYEIDPNGGGSLDTLTADGDRLEDVMIGIPYYNSYQDAMNERTLLGTVHLIHGSTQIPVHLNAQFDVSQPQTHDATIELYPNPAKDNASIILRGLEGEVVSIHVRDVLGRDVYHAKHRSTSNAEVYRMDVSSLSAGSYSFQVQGSKNFVSKLTIVK
jgi:hypothetical protein